MCYLFNTDPALVLERRGSAIPEIYTTRDLKTQGANRYLYGHNHLRSNFQASVAALYSQILKLTCYWRQRRCLCQHQAVAHYCAKLLNAASQTIKGLAPLGRLQRQHQIRSWQIQIAADVASFILENQYSCLSIPVF